MALFASGLLPTLPGALPNVPKQPGLLDRLGGLLSGGGESGPAWAAPALQFGLGLLQQSGWQDRPVTFGEAIGRAGAPVVESMMQRRAEERAEKLKQKETEKNREAYVFKPSGEVDINATTRNLAKIDPKMALQFMRESQLHERGLISQSIQNQEVQRRIEEGKLKAQQQARGTARQRATETFFGALQAGLPEGEALARAQQVHGAQLQAMGLQPAVFDPAQMQVGEDGGIQDVGLMTDTGEMIEAGGAPAAGGAEFLSVARPSAAAPAPIPGLAPTPEEIGGQPLTAQRPTGVPADYNWQLAYLYSASRLPRYNPATSDIVLDYRTGQPMVNEPRLAAAERRAKAGAARIEQNVDLGAAFGKPAQTKIEEGMINAADGIRRLDAVRQSFDPEYLTLARKWQTIVSSAKEKLGGQLSDREKEALADFTKFRRATLANLNLYIKSITGAAMTEGEAARITASLPSMDDSPTEFHSKMNDAVEELQANLEAYADARSRGANALEPYRRGQKKEVPAAKPIAKPVAPKPQAPKVIDFKDLK